MKHIAKKFIIKKIFLFKLQVLIVILSLVPLSIISFYSYRNSKNMIEQQLIETNYNYLMQIVNAADTIISQINETFIYFSTLNEITSFNSFPGGKYYENITGSIMREDSLALYDYLNKKQDVVKLLYILKSSNVCFKSAYLLDYSKDLVISSDGTEYSIAQFNSMEFGNADKIIDGESIYGNKSIIKIVDKHGNESRVIPLLYSLDYRKSCLIINIDMDMIYKNIFINLSSRLENELIIAVDTHEFLYDKNSNLAHNFIEYGNIGQLMSSQNGNEFINLLDNNILMTRHISSKYGWTFFNIIKLDDLYRDISRKNNLIFFVTIIVLLISLSLGILETKKFYKPVNNLVNLVRNNARDDTAQEDELCLIENALKNSLTQNELMREKLQEGLVASQERFIKLMLDNQFNKREIIEGIEYFNIPILPYNIMILLISSQSMNSKNEIIESKEYIRVSIIEMVYGIINKRFKGVTVEVKEGIFAAIFNCSEDELASVYHMARQIQSSTSRGFFINCVVGIGYLCNDAALLPKVYDEIYQAMRRRRISDNDDNKVFYINDIAKNDDGLFFYSKEYEKILNNCIKCRDINEAKKTLNLMISKMNSDNKTITFCNVQYAAMQVLSNLIFMSSELGIDLEKCSDTRTNLYTELLGKDSVLTITIWLEFLIDRIIGNISDDQVLRANEYVVQVLNLIRNNYSMDISLTSIADELGLNSSYLSRMLKENTGKTFVEHINEIRMENSKRLLMETKISVTSLSEKMGYSNSNYFIKMFRKYTGITPGEFKKLHGSNNHQ